MSLILILLQQHYPLSFPWMPGEWRMTEIRSPNETCCCSQRFWSIVFHVHDSWWTERMDYFSATSVLIFYLYAILIRLIGSLCGPQSSSNPSSLRNKLYSMNHHNSMNNNMNTGLVGHASVEIERIDFEKFNSTRDEEDFSKGISSGLRLHVSIGALFGAFFVYHIHYLSFRNFDYGYNMRINIAAG